MTDSDKDDNVQQTSFFRNYSWPIAVIALLAGQAVLLLAMVYLAVSDPSFAVEPDYYQKGLGWDETAAQEARNRELGWEITLELADPKGTLEERELRCLVTDAFQGRIGQAVVDMVAFPHSRGNQRTAAVLEEVGPGVYATNMRFRRKGLWEFRFVVRRDADLFTTTLQQGIYPPGESRPWRP